MTTHQQLTGQTDDELLARMIRSHAERYNQVYWDAFDEHARPRLSDAPVVVDLGCGPGLLLRDLSERVPGAALHGLDLTPAMIESAAGLEYAGAVPTLAVHDLLKDRLPFDDASVDLVAVTAVLHLFDDLFPLLTDVKRVLKPAGTLLMYEWVRTSLAEYMARPQDNPTGDPAAAQRRRLKLFAAHNHYAVEDWRWILHEAGFPVAGEALPNGQFHRLFVAYPRDGA